MGWKLPLVKVKLSVINSAQNNIPIKRTPISGSLGGARTLKSAVFDLTL